MTPAARKPIDLMLFFLPAEEASALVNLGAALEPFVEDKSPLDMATARLDEQLAQQSRPASWIVDEATDAIEDVLWNVLPEPPFDRQKIREAAAAAVNAIHGLYEKATVGVEKDDARSGAAS